MGQYHNPVAVDRREYVHPHRLDCGLKMAEIFYSGYAVARVLYVGDHAEDGDLAPWPGTRPNRGCTPPAAPRRATLPSRT